VKLQVFSVFDAKTMAYLTPVYMHTKGEMLRAMVDCYNLPDHQFRRHPSDYTVFHLGEYDDQDASFNLLTPKLTLGTIEEICAPLTQKEITEKLKPVLIDCDKEVQK